MVGDVVRHFVHVLTGVDIVMRGKGSVEMRRLLRDEPPGTGAQGYAGCGVAFSAVHAQTTGPVVDRRDAIALSQRLAGGVGGHALTQPIYVADHLVAGHDAAFTELAAPHVHFRATHVGARYLGEDRAGLDVRQPVFVKFDLAGTRDIANLACHTAPPASGMSGKVAWACLLRQHRYRRGHSQRGAPTRGGFSSRAYENVSPVGATLCGRPGGGAFTTRESQGGRLSSRVT